MVLLAAAARVRTEGGRGEIFSAAWARVAVCALFALALFRAVNSYSAFQGLLTAPDEGPFSRIYVNGLSTGVGAYGGATQLVLGLLYAAWYKCLSTIDVPFTRLFTSILVTLGIGTFFFLARRELGRSIGLLTALFMSMGAWTVLFSALSIETSSLFLSVPFVLLLLSWMGSRRDARAAFGAGYLGSLALLSYPGAGFYLGTLFLSSLLVNGRGVLSWIRSREALAFLGGISIALGLALLTHFLVLRPREAEALPYAYVPFLGTGWSPAPAWQYLDAAFIVFQETFFGGRSIYLDRFPDEPFLAASLWGFFAVGARSVIRGSDPRLKALQLSIPLLLLFCCLLPNVSGLRRALGALPAAYLVCAIGAVELWRLLDGKKALRAAAFGAVVLCLASSSLVLVPGSMRALAGSPAPAVPDGLLLQALRKGSVALDAESFRGPHGYLDAYVTRASGQLMARVDWPGPGRETFFLGQAEPTAGCLTVFSWAGTGSETKPPIPLPGGFAVVSDEYVFTAGTSSKLKRIRLQREGSSCSF